MGSGFNIATAILWVIPLLAAVVLHEIAHGWMAARLGDRTAELQGRLTLNPLAHIDPMGTVMVPGLLIFLGSPFLFGWAKPVPVDERNLNDPRYGMVKVALAGPAMNLILAVFCAIVLGLTLRSGGDPSSMPAGGDGLDMLTPIRGMALLGLRLNVVLAVFNLLPLPPLDGGRVAVGLLPYGPARALASLEPYGFLILLGLMSTGVVWSVINPVVQFILYAVLSVVVPGVLY